MPFHWHVHSLHEAPDIALYYQQTETQNMLLALTRFLCRDDEVQLGLAEDGMVERFQPLLRWRDGGRMKTKRQVQVSRVQYL